jgi:prephenate dehydrogenase
VSTETPPFTAVAIAGLGLIGGSIALAIRDRWPGTRVVGIDRPAVIAHVLGSGAIDRGAPGVTGIADVDLVILAAPIRQNMALLRELAAAPRTAVVITDVGGTKREIVEESRRIDPALPFVGGHPIGGAERGGFAFARPDLFEGRPWIFTPHDPAPDQTGGVTASAAAESTPLHRLDRFVRGLGARPAVMEAGAHDRLMAFLSHLPQLTVSALMETAGREAGTEGLRLAGRGLVDSTRLASSPADVWRDICATNSEAIGEALDRLIARLTELRADLSRGAAVDAVFDEAARWRAELMKGRD